MRNHMVTSTNKRTIIFRVTVPTYCVSRIIAAIMATFKAIPTCSFYGRSKCSLPPAPQISDNSDTSDEEENMTLQAIRAKIQQTRGLIRGRHNMNIVILVFYIIR